MPLNWTTHQISELLGGQSRGADVAVAGMSHDTRLMTGGELFLALKGQHSDGHDHLAEARAQGAGAALVSHGVDDPLPQVVVGDVLLAAGQLAAAWRASLDVQVVGITGSNGKTSVKEMVATILKREGETLATAGNYNNEIGVPITLSRLGAEHRYAVIEMGAAREGDIRYLSQLAKPQVGILTNAGPAHLESFGSIDTIVQTKGELFRALADDGTAIINADSPYASRWRDWAAHCHGVHFGVAPSAEFRADIPDDYAMGQAVPIDTPEGAFELVLTVPGQHNISNALAAMAAAHTLGVPIARAVEALATLNSVAQRLQIHHPTPTVVIIDDSYNANPASTEAALGVLANQAGERWLVLGDMLELGDAAQSMHQAIGQQAAALGIDRLFGLGPLARAAVAGFNEARQDTQGQWFDDAQALDVALTPPWPDRVAILVKGSRSMRMDRVVMSLMEAARSC